MKIILKYLIILWIILAVFNIFYNTRKTWSEIRDWGFLSDTQKRHKIFGDFYDYLTLIQSHTDTKANILIFSKDADKYQTFFLSIYYLYPRTTVTTIDKKEFVYLLKNNKFDFVATYNDTLTLPNYIKIATFSSELSTQYGTIYKRK